MNCKECNHKTGTGEIDPCVQPFIDALNNAGIKTIASCCGHGYMPMSIILEDNRWVHISRDWEEGFKIDKSFSLDINGQRKDNYKAFCHKYGHLYYSGEEIPQECQECDSIKFFDLGRSKEATL